MSEAPATSDRRAQHVAAFGFLLQLACFAVLLGVSLWSHSDAIAALARFVGVVLPAWLIVYLVFKQLRRVSAEALESAELQRARSAGGGEALFGMDEEALLLEQNRLQWMVKWMLPVVTVLLALILAGGYWVGWTWTLDGAFARAGEGSLRRTQQPTLMMWFVVFVGFLCFLYARYTLALSRMNEWRLLRAPAILMGGNALACLLLAVALMTSHSIPWAEPLVAGLVRILLLLLGVEFTANFILDLYRPRTPGVVPRPSFESRLLGLISEPGGIARSIADAINYQFGFEVSSTWFYQLLQRWLFPITVFTLLVVLALTSVVIVNADEQVVVERFGKVVQSGEGAAFGPGIHFKWPYPIDVVRRAPVRRISEVVVGEATEEESDEHAHRAIVWTEAHDYVPELMLLVASPQAPSLSAGQSRTQSVAVSLLMVSVPIEYRVRDLHKYLYSYEDPQKLVECIAYQYLSDFGAGVDIDRLMGPGREAFNQDFRDLLQKRLDELDAGIEVVFAGIRGAHPPAQEGVAAAFQEVVSAQTRMSSMINAARGEAQRRLTTVAGTEERALALDGAIRMRDRLQAAVGADPAALIQARQQVDELLMGAPHKDIPALSGDAAARIADARAAASSLVADAEAKVRVFATDMAAYDAAPDLFKQRRLLEVYAGLDNVRKYLIVGDPGMVVVEYETLEESGLDRVLQEGVAK